MTDIKLNETEWTKIRDFLREDSRAYVGKEANCRRFIEAVKWISRSGGTMAFAPY